MSESEVIESIGCKLCAYSGPPHVSSHRIKLPAEGLKLIFWCPKCTAAIETRFIAKDDAEGVEALK